MRTNKRRPDFYGEWSACYLDRLSGQRLATSIQSHGSSRESYCGALKGAKLLTTFSWVGIPAVWILAYCGLLSHSAEELLYEFFDFIIKSGVSCIIMHSSLKTYAEKKEEQMRAELAEERGTIKALRETARMKVHIRLIPPPFHSELPLRPAPH